VDPENRARFEMLLSGLNGVPLLIDRIDAAITNITIIRKELASLLRGKIVVVGFTALGTDSDVVITPVDSRTPGPMVHVAVINSLLTELFRVPWPLWADFVVIGLMGLAGTWLGVRFNVVTGPLALAGLVLGWFFVAGALLWDTSLIIAAVAGPSVAATGSWVTVLLHRLLVEQRGRKVTEERFKSYVSPAVVDILVNNPELGTMKPSMREMTVMFTDVADFTTTSERLGPELLAKCLSKYLKEMTEILQKNRGTLDKYLGDGIMCFWNAPIDDAQHARHAALTAVQMMKRLEELNDSGAFEEAGRLKVRVGICTGPCMVGDFGNPPRNSNYTLLGDTANFAARLEGANKFFGTRILATQRVRDQAGLDVRWRSIGKVFVKGKKEADWLYELIGPLEPHGPATDEWLSASDEAVRDFVEGRFDPCLKKFDMLARRFGDVQLAAMYAETISAWRARPDYPAAFDGAIVLTEK
jgi:adenylate cyclase